ncbi:MAG TPA: M20/M25/M40 family metallo-hydrolase [Longimicrobiales bacterium]|nr:M20/M25/M40 family metallo-hydrolase [Longimicrobiales bacterium]
MRKLSLTTAALALLAAAGPAGAQTFTSDEPVLQRIWQLGMEQSETENLAQALLDSIGPRLSGTDMQKRGNDWLIHMYNSWGIAAHNEQVGTWRGWRRGHSHIDMLEPRMRTLEGTMLGWSPGTGGQPVTAEAIILPRFETEAEFEAWLPQVRGRYVLVSAPQPTCRPRAEWEQHATPQSLARMNALRDSINREWAGPNVRGTGLSLALGTGELGLRLEQAGAAGIIALRNKDQAGTYDVFETYNQRAPAITLACEDYGLVFRATEREQNTRLRMNLDAELLGEQPIYNTIATVRGTELPNEYVMLSAHFDSWDGASGATDNGTGTLVMMEAMRILSEVYPNPKRTIIAGHWTAEEHGLVGSRAFTEDNPEIVDNIHAFFNQDNGTGRIVRINAGGIPDAARQMSEWLARIPEEISGEINMPGPGSPSGGGTDDASFACHGVPAFGLGALSWNYGASTWHTNRDTYDKVVFDDLKNNATLIAMLVYLAAEAPAKISRERIELGGGRDWPACQAAPRQTAPRMR